MLDSYPFAKSHKRGIIDQGIHLNTYHILYNTSGQNKRLYRLLFHAQFFRYEVLEIYL